MRAVKGLVRVDTESHAQATSEGELPDVLMLVSMGEGLMGAPGRLHGGFTATVLDMVVGFAINATEKATPITTANLNVDFKAPCSLPSVALAKAWVVKREGRKRLIKATFEDEHGKIIATANSLYVVMRLETNTDASKKAKI
jgi:acyl-coenzyme A thioesterase PaaI-like protein